MSECPYCHQPILESQILCMNCGSQIKPLEVKYRLFWRKRSVVLSHQQPYIFEAKLIEGKTREIKRKLRTPYGNTTLDKWL